MTIRDVAKSSGVSIATVSRVINGSAKVSPQVKLAVEQAMRELNYQKPQAKRRKPTKLFAVIVRNMTNPFFAQLLDVLEEEAYKHGRSILLFNSRNNLQLEKTFLLECENHKVDGVFLIPRSLKEQHLLPMQTLPFPVVLLTTATSMLSSVATHHQHGGELVAKHLFQKGHRRIGYIGTDNRQSDRFIGFKDSLEKHGVELRRERVLSPYTEESLQQYIDQQITHAQSPLSAVFCSDDICASQLCNGIKQQAIHTCPDVEIIGFDDTFIAQSLGFSSVKQPIKQIALFGFELMLKKLKHSVDSDEPDPLEHILLEPTLMLRSEPSNTMAVRKTEILRPDRG